MSTQPKLTANNLIRQVDLPTWEWIRQLPAGSSGLSSACTGQNGVFHPEHGRYVYYLVANANFWRYDTWSDGWMQLQSPPFSTTTLSDMEFLGGYGPTGRVLSATSTTLTIAGLPHRCVESFEVRIVGGTGKGQRRQISVQNEPQVADRGIATTVAAGTTATVTDSTKSWQINQWVGYSVRIEFSTGVNQIRRILSNSATTLTYVTHASYSENVNAAVAQMATLPVSGASIYSIEATTLTVETAWATTPNQTSMYRVLSGAIAYTYSATLSPCIYNIAEDTWYLVAAPSAIMAASATESRLTACTETQNIWWNGKASSGTQTTLVDSEANWAVNEWVGKLVWITAGTAEGLIRRITSNTATQLTWHDGVPTHPQANSRYAIEGYDGGVATSGGASTLTDSTQAWETNRWVNYRVKIVFGTGIGQSLNILSNTATQLTVVQPWASSAANAVTPDSTSVYLIEADDTVLYSAHAPTAAIVRTSLTNGITHCGAQIDQGAVVSGAAQYADFAPVAVVATTGTTTQAVITQNAHGFQTGWSIKHSGDTSASAAQNNITAVITVTGTNAYTYSAPGSSAAWLISSSSLTTLKDATKNWATNEHAGRLVRFSTGAPLAGGASTQVTAVIASNTANTLTFATSATGTPLSGLSNYVITKNDAIGRMDGGIATGAGQLTTALQDTSKSWVANIHVGRRLRWLSHNGEATEALITANTANTLTFAAATLPVAGATAYAILGQVARGTGLCLVMQSGGSREEQQGRFLYSHRGGAAYGTDRFDLTTNECLQMASLQQTETLTTGTMTCYDGHDRIWFTKDNTQRLYCLNVSTGVISAGPQAPYVAGNATIGNRMTITETRDRLKFLIFNRHNNVEMYRTLLFWE